MLCEKFKIFLDAINNEIDIDQNCMKRLGRDRLGFTPIRPSKSLPYIDKYRVTSFLYRSFVVLFVLISPIYLFIKFIKAILKSNRYRISKYMPSNDLVLVANGRVEYLVKRLGLDKSNSFLNVNQSDDKERCHVYHFLGLKDYFYVYLISVVSVGYLLWKLKDKSNLLQVYVAYEWFLVYVGLSKGLGSINNIYFANHYDRWAVMFDQIFAGKNIILLQHGVLPEKLSLSYKLRNINEIFTLNYSSEDVFKKIFFCVNTKFKRQNICLNMAYVQSERKTVLIIGQPHSINSEIEMGNALKACCDVYIKPHPLYNYSGYKKIKGGVLIEDKGFYPCVDVALCYESTLGLEYEASGVKVIWWKGMDTIDIVQVTKKILEEA